MIFYFNSLKINKMKQFIFLLLPFLVVLLDLKEEEEPFLIITQDYDEEKDSIFYKGEKKYLYAGYLNIRNSGYDNGMATVYCSASIFMSEDINIERDFKFLKIRSYDYLSLSYDYISSELDKDFTLFDETIYKTKFNGTYNYNVEFECDQNDNFIFRLPIKASNGNIYSIVRNEEHAKAAAPIVIFIFIFISLLILIPLLLCYCCFCRKRQEINNDNPKLPLNS